MGIDLDIFFYDDQDLMHFSKWLRETVKYCDTYEISY